MSRTAATVKNACSMGFSACKKTNSHVRSLLMLRSKADGPPNVHPMEFMYVKIRTKT